jgi:hypothetical protein
MVVGIAGNHEIQDAAGPSTKHGPGHPAEEVVVGMVDEELTSGPNNFAGLLSATIDKFEVLD